MIQREQKQPITEIRSDLWNSMTVTELSDQLSLVIDKKLLLMQLGTNSTPSIKSLYMALEGAEQSLNDLITSK